MPIYWPDKAAPEVLYVKPQGCRDFSAGSLQLVNTCTDAIRIPPDSLVLQYEVKLSKQSERSSLELFLWSMTPNPSNDPSLSVGTPLYSIKNKSHRTIYLKQKADFNSPAEAGSSKYTPFVWTVRPNTTHDFGFDKPDGQRVVQWRAKVRRPESATTLN